MIMAEQRHIPLGVGFYPDWFHNHYGISYDKRYYFDPETRIAARMEMEKRLYERFGDVGLGNPSPEPKPLITFGMVMLPAVFGCDIVFKENALPWAMPLNLSEDEIMRLEVPDLFNMPPMTDVIRQIDYLKEKYGRVVGDINTTGVQNLALKIRGEQLYIDYFENPKLCHHLLRICTETIIRLFEFNKKVSGTGAVDVTPMCDPKLCVLPNCTIEQVSLKAYEEFLLPYDNQVADACAPVGIHHCGSVDQVLEGYAKVHHLAFLEIGFGSDVRRAREVLGPEVALNARISPVLMKNGTPEEVSAEVRRLIDQGPPLSNFSIDTVGLTHGTPDENVRTARRTAAEYGSIHLEKERSARIVSFQGTPKRLAFPETVVLGTDKTVVIGPRHPLVIIGERINPTGRKNLAQAIEAGDLRLLQEEAVRQVKEGAHIVDVNVGVSGIDEARMLKEAVLAIQAVTDVPLCLDSALPGALEAALRVYRGKAIVNSVNGEKQRLDQVLPLVKAHGAAVIGLTMDEKGIPKHAEARLAIARRIVEAAESAGIPRQDVIIDPLAMAVSADDQAALETIRALQLIRDELGVNQTLGLSNISFGLPDRTAINASFMAMVVLCGVTCPIIDPTHPEMRKASLIANMLLGKDEFCMSYISSVSRKTGQTRETEPAEAAGPVPGQPLDALKEAVIHGKRKTAIELTQRALDQGVDPNQLIDRTLIPALNTVGGRFERREIFVPEMMMSAKTMQACVDLIRPLLRTKTAEHRGTVVLGTVLGDLHDIGKNLAKLLLESSGFQVIDLGENVPPDRFVEAARVHHADVVGLSSLLTTGDPHVEETVKAIRQSEMGGKVKVICGGAALTSRFVVETCGADAYVKDAAEGVKRIKQILEMNGL
jgi:methanogenic corrinoid protein MtbC1/uroporphyrinogen-III decarboxylase